MNNLNFNTLLLEETERLDNIVPLPSLTYRKIQ